MFIGLIALNDPPRADSPALLAELRSLGVHTVMVTGDAPLTAVSVAHAIGLDGRYARRGMFPSASVPMISRFTRASSLRRNFVSSKRFSATAMRSACAATAPTTLRRCARRKWV